MIKQKNGKTSKRGAVSNMITQSENKNLIETKRFFCILCGSNGKSRLTKITSACSAFYACSKCLEEFGGKSGCLEQFLQIQNIGQTLSLSNLQLTRKLFWVEKKLKALERNFEEELQKRTDKTKELIE